MYNNLQDRATDMNSELFNQLYPKLRKYCQFLTQNVWDGDDIAQETIVKALTTEKYHHQMSSALLNKMAYHFWIDTVRRRKKEQLNTLGEELSVDNKDISQLKETIDLLLSTFTPKQAIIFTLKEAFGYKGKEIADLLGTTEIAVKSVIHRARKRLEKEEAMPRQLYWEENEYELFSNILYKALKADDPEILIKSIPVLPSLRTEGIKPKPISRKTFSPYSTLTAA